MALMRTDVSEERVASIVMTGIGEVETKLAVTSNRSTYSISSQRASVASFCSVLYKSIDQTRVFYDIK
jgi:hypothetical protein